MGDPINYLIERKCLRVHYMRIDILVILFLHERMETYFLIYQKNKNKN